MKLGSNIINSPPKQSFLAEFNKENECENIATTNLNNMIKDNLTRTNDESTFLDEVELLDMNCLEDSIYCQNNIPSNGSHDSRTKRSESLCDTTLFTQKFPIQLNNITPAKYPAGSSAAQQYETLKKQAKLPINNNSNNNIKGENTPRPDSASSSSDSPKRHPGLIAAGETKSFFGLRSPKISNEGKLPKDVVDGVVVVRDSRKPPPLSLPRAEGDASAASDSFFPNKSFDDVLSAVDSFSSPPPPSTPIRNGEDVMQKSISRSQENCFSSPGGGESRQAQGPQRLGRASCGSMNKLSNVEEVENMARMQADCLRQMVKSGLSSKRLSQSTDRLRQTANYSLSPEAGKKIAYDSDDSIVSKATVSPKTSDSQDASGMAHPQSLPNIIPQSRVLQSRSKLTSPGLSTLSTESKSGIFRSSSKMSTPGVDPLHSQQPQSRIRNFSSTRVPSQRAPERENRSGDGTPPPAQRAPSKIATRQVSRLQPPQSRRARIDRTALDAKSADDSLRSQESQNRTGSSIGSTSPSGSSFTDDGQGCSKPTSIPVSRSNQRFSSIPRPKHTSK